MISKEHFLYVVTEGGSATDKRTKENILSVKRQRETYKHPFKTSREGHEMLETIIADSGIFTAEDSDTSSRAFALRLLESMGILDEGNIKKLVDFMLSDSMDIVPGDILDVAEEE